MEIRFIPDRNGDANPPDLLGDICLSDGRNTILDNCTYPDPWLDALKKGTRLLRHEKVASIDLVEESNPLVFEKRDSHIVISYGDSFIFVNSVEEILLALQDFEGRDADKG
ncbi:hypothetical protein [Leptolyngbya sp. 7M]|uniref:hypothetical protein n=1 Tax=Leptolyngbya sp. 7M TaxID=2812896 RepID=UPI001B8C9DED|nr:hypothetical protein [Leptolyngbya sp. 7M]QYO65809.1 hypothetical protein JVX88_03155 [Leptolyngbya sp. 7M]